MTFSSPPATPVDTVVIPTRLFGPIRMPSDQIVTFPDGLLGFAGEHRFVLLPAATDGVFWLQSADEGNLAFLVVDPFRHFADYQVDFEPQGPVHPDMLSREDVALLGIVTLPTMPADPPTVNLRGPLLFDLAARTGHQVILTDATLSTREPLTFSLPTAATPSSS